ncbi:hypothetical protein VUR80DRAFT_9835 [Thermomyces stellatus]
MRTAIPSRCYVGRRSFQAPLSPLVPWRRLDPDTSTLRLGLACCPPSCVWCALSSFFFRFPQALARLQKAAVRRRYSPDKTSGKGPCRGALGKVHPCSLLVAPRGNLCVSQPVVGRVVDASAGTGPPSSRCHSCTLRPVPWISIISSPARAKCNGRGRSFSARESRRRRNSMSAGLAGSGARVSEERGRYAR